jgi:hypothetical protein
MDATASCRNNLGLWREIRIDKLSDEFRQYTLVLTCSACGHERTAEPHTLGRICGWDARLEDVAKRMRCPSSKVTPIHLGSSAAA